MERQIFELINRNYQEIRNNNEYYLKLQLGKYESVNIFDDVIYKNENDLLNFLNNYKQITNNEYYQYQYENQYYQRYRNFKSNSFTDSLIDFEICKFQSQLQINTKTSHSYDYRFSIHRKKPLVMFSQHMNYHNIIFVKDKRWQITDECQLILNEINKKTLNQKSTEVYFHIKIPLSEQSLDKILKEIDKFLIYFKHKYDKKHKFHSLDSVLESEQPHLELVQDTQP
jgi:hypothetical protein